jgi:hypothetical protein
MLGAVFVYIVAYLSWHLAVRRRPLTDLGWRHAWWIPPYLAGMWLISYLGPAGPMGGAGAIGFFAGMWLIAGFSLVVLWAAIASGQSSQAAQRCAEFIKTLGSSGVESPARPQEPHAP